jgi:hypothetical protein
VTYLLKDIRDHLQESADINDAFADRIYPEVVPQGVAYPFINLSELSNSPEESLGGEIGTHETIITVDAWTDGSGGSAAAKRYGEMIRNMLSGYKGRLGEGVWCNGAHLIRNQVLASDPAQPGSDVHRRRVSQDYRIFHSADVPSFA